MAMTDIYVDPSIAGNSGTGTSGDPYGDLQYALDQTTLGTDGSYFHIKAGTAEVLTASISFTTHGTPTATQPVVFRGYTSTKEDGGIGSISGVANSVGVCDTSTLDYITFMDLSMVGNTTGATINLDNAIVLYNCYIENTGSGGVVNIDQSTIMNCEVVSDTGFCLEGLAGTTALWCYFRNTGTSGGQVKAGIIQNCLAVIDMSTDSNDEAFRPPGDSFNVDHCTIIASATPGSDCWGIATEAREGCLFTNNYIEGWNGTSGGGIKADAGGEGAKVFNNYYYNNTTNEQDNSGNSIFEGGTNLGASGVDANYLPQASLQNLGVVTAFKGLGSTLNYTDVGAVQGETGGGGSGGIASLVGIGGGLVGRAT